jgi:hypothetical protein
VLEPSDTHNFLVRGRVTWWCGRLGRWRGQARSGAADRDHGAARPGRCAASPGHDLSWPWRCQARPWCGRLGSWRGWPGPWCYQARPCCSRLGRWHGQARPYGATGRGSTEHGCSWSVENQSIEMLNGKEKHKLFVCSVVVRVVYLREEVQGSNLDLFNFFLFSLFFPYITLFFPKFFNN